MLRLSAAVFLIGGPIDVLLWKMLITRVSIKEIIGTVSLGVRCQLSIELLTDLYVSSYLQRNFSLVHITSDSSQLEGFCAYH